MISARWRRAMLALACALTSAGAWAQEEPAVVRRATQLREQPGEASRSIAPLAADTAVTRLPERSGPYVRVRTAAGAVGWVHLFDVGAPGSSNSSGGASGLLRGVTGFFSKSTRPTTVSTSTIGIRGLGAEDLAQAQPDTAAVTRMEALRVSEQQARQFAGEAQLVPASVQPLPAPPRPASSNGPPGSQP